MKKEVKIRVKGIQSNVSGEEIVVEARGIMLYKEPYYYVSYEEKIDQKSTKSSKTVLRFSDRKLRVTRKGEVESVLEFVEGGVHNSLYMTAMGNFEVEITTDKLIIELSERSKSILADYRIGLNEMPPSHGKLEIRVEEAES